MDNQKTFNLYFPEAATADLSLFTGGGVSNVLTVREYDGSPSVTNVVEINVNNGTLTDNGFGEISLDNGGLIELQRAATHSLFYPNTAAGLTNCLAVTTNGDTVVLPGCDLALTSWTLPVGVSITGKGVSSILRGKIVTAASGVNNISSLLIDNHSGNGVDVDNGTTNIWNCNITSLTDYAVYVLNTGTVNVYHSKVQGERGDFGGNIFTLGTELDTGTIAANNESGGIVATFATDKFIAVDSGGTAWNNGIGGLTWYFTSSLNGGAWESDYYYPTVNWVSYIGLFGAVTPGYQRLVMQPKAGDVLRIRAADSAGSFGDNSGSINWTLSEVTITRVNLYAVETSKNLGIPQKGDRSAWNTEYGNLHASDIESLNHVYHLPTPTTEGYIPVVVGGYWVETNPGDAGVAPLYHHENHENGGMDEISVAGLSGVLVDKQDADKLQGRSLASTAPSDTQVIKWDNVGSTWKPAAETPIIEDTETPVTKRSNLDFIGFTITDDSVNDRTKVAIPAGAGMIAPGSNGDIAVVVTGDWVSQSPATTGYVFPPSDHHTRHENAGDDEISVLGLSGLLADGQTPLSHKTSHENGGTDEISVLGLSGLLADSQTPLAHRATHQFGGGDALNLAGLSGLLATPQTPAFHYQAASSVTLSGLTGYLTGMSEVAVAMSRIDTLLSTAHNWTMEQNIALLAVDNIYPYSDSVLGIQFLKADNATNVMTLDTTDRKLNLDMVNGVHRANIANGHLNFVSVVKPVQPTAALAGVGAGNVDNGNHQYFCSYITAYGETAYSTASTAVTVTDKTTNGKVNINVTASTNIAVTNIKVYRSKIAGNFAYYLLTTLSNTTATYLDNIADSALGASGGTIRDNTTAGIFYIDGSQYFYAVNNVFVGVNVAPSFTSSTQCVGIGPYALNALTSGGFNTAVGSLAGQKITTGAFNVLLGASAGNSITITNSNTYIGHNAGTLNTGARNVMIGFNVGSQLTSVNDKLAIDVTNTLVPLIYGDFGVRTLAFDGSGGWTKTDTGTNTVYEIFTLDHETIGVPDVGFGVRFSQYLEDTTTPRVLAASEDTSWANATHASFAARKIFNIYDFGGLREAFRIEASGTAPMIGFLGASAIVRPSSTTDLRQAMINLGLYTTGGATPLNLNGGALTVGSITAAGYNFAVAVKSSTYLLTSTDDVVVFTATSTANLPAATGSGKTYRIINEGAAGTVVTIDGNGTETIKGSLTQVLYFGEDLIITDYATGKWA
jgi:hypothetical protein